MIVLEDTRARDRRTLITLDVGMCTFEKFTCTVFGQVEDDPYTEMGFN